MQSSCLKKATMTSVTTSMTDASSSYELKTPNQSAHLMLLSTVTQRISANVQHYVKATSSEE